MPGTANPALIPTPPPPVPLRHRLRWPRAWQDPTAPNTKTRASTAPLPAEAAPASFGGNVGPVGSPQERDQLGVITGQPATSATQLLLGPVARGTTVSVAQEATDEIPRRADRPVAVHGRRSDVDLAGLCHAAARRRRAARSPTRRCSPTCSGCAKATTSGWPGSGSAVSKTSNCRAIWRRCRSCVQTDQQVLGNTVASVTYQNIVGQRYLGLSLGNAGRSGPAAAGQRHPGRTHRPVLRRRHAAQRLRAAVQPAQPARRRQPHQGCHPVAAGRHRLDHRPGRPDLAADRRIRRSRPGTRRRDHRSQHRGGQPGADRTTISTMSSPKPASVVATFDARRPELVDSMGSMARVMRQLSTISDEVYPSLNELVTREPGFASAYGRHRAAAGLHRRQPSVAAQGIRPDHQRRRLRQRLRVRPEHPRDSSPGSTT